MFQKINVDKTVEKNAHFSDVVIMTFFIRKGDVHFKIDNNNAFNFNSGTRVCPANKCPVILIREVDIAIHLY